MVYTHNSLSLHLLLEPPRLCFSLLHVALLLLAALLLKNLCTGLCSRHTGVGCEWWLWEGWVGGVSVASTQRYMGTQHHMHTTAKLWEMVNT